MNKESRFPWEKEDGKRYEDVTERFLSFCSELELGELLHRVDFGLSEAMSAIELMDPVMDAGMSRPQRKPYTFVTAMIAGHLKLKGLSYSEKIGIIDETFTCLVTWLEGHSLVVTVLTNLYLHSPNEIIDPCLKTFSIGIIRLVVIIKDLVTHAGVFEEEDFQTRCYDFNVFSNVSEVELTQMLRKVEEDLSRTVNDTNFVVEETTKEEEENTFSENELQQALLARIKFLRLLYGGLCNLHRNDVQEGKKRLKSALGQIPKILDTLSVGLQRQDSSSDNPFIGFEPLANQVRLPTVYPFVIEIRSREPSIIYLKEMIQRLLHATSVTTLTSFHTTLDFFIEFGKGETCVLSRSVLQTLYLPFQNYYHKNHNSTTTAPYQHSQTSSSSGPAAFRDLIRNACKTFIAPPALVCKTPPYTGKQIRDCLHSFFSVCCLPMAKFLSAFGHNRARQRVKIAALLEDFSIFQEEADKLDTMLNAVANTNQMLFFSTWLLYHVLRLMIRYLLSGFELELYSTHEYTYIYWYLFELLYPWLTTCIQRADSYVLEQGQYSESQSTSGKSKKKVKNNNKKRIHPHAREATCYQAYSILCAGYFKLLIGLRKENQITVPHCEFDNGSVRYERRFAPFANLLTPPLMPYSQYLEVYNHLSKGESSRIFEAAAKDFCSSRKMFELAASYSSGPSPSGGFATGSCGFLPQEECNKLISVAKNNFVVSSILASASKRKVDFDFSLHRTFPIIKFV